VRLPGAERENHALQYVAANRAYHLALDALGEVYSELAPRFTFVAPRTGRYLLLFPMSRCFTPTFVNGEFKVGKGRCSYGYFLVRHPA
jgi:hypothetical protein